MFKVGEIIRRCKTVIQQDYLPYENISDWKVKEVVHRTLEDRDYTEYLVEHIRTQQKLSEYVCEVQLLSEIKKVNNRDITEI